MRANHPDSGRTLPARTPILTGTTKYLIGRWLFASSIQDRSPLLAASLTDAAASICAERCTYPGQVEYNEVVVRLHD